VTVSPGPLTSDTKPGAPLPYRAPYIPRTRVAALHEGYSGNAAGPALVIPRETGRLHYVPMLAGRIRRASIAATDARGVGGPPLTLWRRSRRYPDTPTLRA
jgi:hypothetical protein